DDFDKQLNFYNQEAKKYILANLKDYIPMHLVRAVPFFFQSGYFEMWSAYSGEFSKPDITGQLLKGNYADILIFFKNINLKLIVYILGIIFWGIFSISVFVSLVYSYFRDKQKFFFFLTGLVIVLYTASISAPGVLARYRLPIYLFFILPFVYMISKIFNLSDDK
ncbi:MAG: hypothetical protein NTW06_05050, partial [Candidatus Falkowbacteria bacterium]|nr:hypothetical protein [Candidatus Falkowbacteria bacterium]